MYPLPVIGCEVNHKYRNIYLLSIKSSDMHGPVNNNNNPVGQNFEIKIFDDQCLSQTYHITVFTKQTKFEDTKVVISSCKSTQDRQYNGQ